MGVDRMWVWSAHRVAEIDKGRAAAARAIFDAADGVALDDLRRADDRRIQADIVTFWNLTSRTTAKGRLSACPTPS